MQNTKAYFMLVCATLFWAGNFMVGKFAFFSNVPPMSLVFVRWSLVWLLLLPFTYKEIIKYKEVIFKNLPLLLFLALTSVGLFNSFTYLSLVYTQVINASLFNTAIPAIIILLCFIFKIEKTNKYQILGLIISVLGILSIITKLNLIASFIVLLGFLGGWAPLLLVVILTGFEIMIAVLQAYVFTILCCLYLNDALNLHH